MKSERREKGQGEATCTCSYLSPVLLGSGGGWAQSTWGSPCSLWVGSLKKNTALEYSTRVVQEGDCRCKKSTLNDLAYLTPLRIPLMNPVYVYSTLKIFNDSSQTTYSTHSRETSRRWLGVGGEVRQYTPQPSTPPPHPPLTGAGRRYRGGGEGGECGGNWESLSPLHPLHSTITSLLLDFLYTLSTSTIWSRRRHITGILRALYRTFS